MLMADGALYIREGASHVWERITPILCIFHFFKAIEDKLCNKDYIPRLSILNGKIDKKPIPRTLLEQFISGPNVPNEGQMNPTRIIRQDIKILQALPSEMLFKKYVKIVKPFWMYFGRKFWEYFNDVYLDPNSSQCRSGWQNYIQENTVSTNNSIEAFNKVMKDVITHSKSLPMSEYLESLCNEVKRRSIESATLINFPTSPQMFPPILTFAFALVGRFDDFFHQGRSILLHSR